MRTTSLWLRVMPWAMFCSITVLPVRGGATINPRVPLPIGVKRSISAGRVLFRIVLEAQLLVRIERREVVEQDLLARALGLLVVDRLDLQQREVALAFLRRADLTGHDVAGAQIEAADLARGDVDVVGTRQVVVVGSAEEPEAVGQDLQHALAVDEAALFGLRAEDREDQLLLAHRRCALDVEVLGDLRELADLLRLQRLQVEAVVAVDRQLLIRELGRFRRRRDGGLGRAVALATPTLDTPGHGCRGRGAIPPDALVGHVAVLSVGRVVVELSGRVAPPRGR